MSSPRRAVSLVLALAAVHALAQTPAPAPVVPVAAAPQYDNGYLKVGFDQLASFVFTPPQYDPTPNAKVETGEEQIPAVIKALNGKKAVVTGYMMPVKIDQGLVTEFLLMRTTLACCFGGVPNMNEWVVVKMKPGVQAVMDTPISFYGQLKIGAIFENGYLTGLYQLDAEKMAEVK